MNSGGITLTVPSGWRTPQGVVGTAGYTTVSTTGVVGSVFNEADSISGWVRNTSNPTACSGGLSIDTSTKHSGTGSLKCINSSDSNNGLWYYSTSTAMNWSTYETIGFWINSSAPINNGDLKFDYSTNTDLSSPLESLSLGTAIPANTWTYVSFNFGATTRTAIKSYGLHIANLSSMRNATVYIDSFSIGASASIVPTFSGNDVVVSAISLTNGQTITVTYGAGGTTSGATAPATPQTSTFTIKSKTVDSGTVTSIATSPTVTVVDTTVPVVSLTAPTTGSTVHGSAVSLTSTASDNVAVSGVTYYIDGTRLGSEVTSPYTSTFDSTSKADGSHSVVAVARDSSSNYATSTAATITIDNTGPVQSSIVSSTAATTATVTWTTDESSNSKVSYGTSSGTYTVATSSASLVTSHSIGLTGLTSSTLYYYVVVSADASGNTSTSTEKTLRTLDVTAPLVSLTSPTNSETIAGSAVALAATGSDNIAVAGVTFYIDGSRIGTEDTTAPYTGTLDSTTLMDGSHSIVAVARDTSNNYATSTAAVVTVSNPAPQLPAVSIVSSNASTTLATTGDSITLSFTTDQSLRSAAVTIAGHAVTVATTTPTTFTATYTMISGDTEGAIAFSIIPTNLSGRSGFTTSTTTDATNVTFDRTAPTNQDTVFSSPVSKQGGATVTVISSGDPTNIIWLAPAGTTVFSPGSTMTTATGNATSILAPSDPGTYYLYVIDAAGNVSVQSIVAVTVDNASPTLGSVTLSTSNASGSLVKPGDTVTVTFTASKTIIEPSVSFTTGGAPVVASVTVTNTTGNTWTATYTANGSDTDGVLAFSIDGLEDTLGNMATAVTSTSDASALTFDGTTPTLSSVTLSSNNASTTLAKVGDIITLTFTASESISSPTVSFTSGGQAVTGSVNVTNTSGNNWRARYTTSSSDTGGTVTYTIGSFHDPAGNNGTSVTSGSGSVRLDKTAPTLSLSSTAGDPTGESPIPVTATFSEAVTGFTTSSIDVGNGSASNLSGSGTNYTFDVTPSGNGRVTVDVDAGAAIDAAGNGNQAPSQLIRIFNSTRPTVVLTKGGRSRTKLRPVTITVTFSADVTGLSAGNFLSSVTNASVTDVTGSGSTYTITVVPDTEGTVEIQVPDSATVDAETNTNHNFASAPLTFVYDATPPGLAEHAAPPALSRNHAQSYEFTSSEDGIYTYSGGCGTGTGSAVSGSNSIAFSDLPDGTYSNCKITVTDDAENTSDELDIPSFTIDTTPPAISHVAATPASRVANAAWNTNEAASTQVVYGLTSAYSSSTPEIDTGTRQSSHEASLSNLVSCTTYHYTASSTDAAGNSGLGTDQALTTRGCAGDADVTSENDSSISRGVGGTVSLIATGSGISVTAPVNFSSRDAHFQIKKLDKTAALGALGTPTTYQTAGDYVYDLHALSDVETAITSFDNPLTVTLNYTAADISSIDESSLRIFRNDAGVWTMLSSCSVNTSAKSVTCTTDHFSTFSIFGHVGVSAPAPAPTSDPRSRSGGSVQGQVKALISMGNQKAADELMRQWPRLFPQQVSGAAQSSSLFTRNLDVGSSGEDVRQLQRFLNDKGFMVAATGPGSKGNETNLYGAATRAALAKFQAANGITPAAGYFGPLTRNTVSSLYADAGISVSNTTIAPIQTTVPLTTPASRDLDLGMTGLDIKTLQLFLVAQSIGPSAKALAANGASGYFGNLTKNALIEYQKANGISSATGFFGPLTRAYMRSAGLIGI